MKGTRKVVVKPLCFKLERLTDGNAGAWRTFEFEDKSFEDWGPHLESITIHSQTESRTAQFEWKVVLWYSFDGRIWNGPHDVISSIQANGEVVHPPFTDKTKLGIKIKMGLATKNMSGTAIESGIVSAASAFQFLT